MKKICCLLLSLILVFSVESVNVLAVEDTNEASFYEESEKDNGEEDTVQSESDNEEVNTADLTEENSIPEKNEDDEAAILASGEDEDPENVQEFDEDENEVELLAGDQNNLDDIEWTVITLSPLEYDDRYSLGDLPEISEADEEYEIFEITSDAISYQVEAGKKTGTKDDVVTQKSEDSLDIIATGVGTATIYLIPSNQEDTEKVEAGFQVNVTVEPATLTLMYLTGQSNMEGWCSSGYDLSASVACEEGTVYSTYAPMSSRSDSIAGVTFDSYCTEDNAENFVAGSLQSDISISGESLTYKLDSLTTNGSGKTGPDSGLAYEWNILTGDKVWVINTARSGTNIASWVPGASLYKRSAAVWDFVDQVFGAEISAGHYTEGRKLAFWLQGESDTETEAENYLSDFTDMYTSMNKELKLDAYGIIMARATSPDANDSNFYTTEKDLVMTGPRIAQYVLGGSTGPSDVYIVSNVNEQWASNEGVKSYFQESYPTGRLDYPMHDSSKSLLPTTVKEIHSDVHYSQIGHNENGITAADGMYHVLYGSAVPSDVKWKNENDESISSLSLNLTGDTAVLVPVVDPSYAAKNISYSLSGNAVLYDESTGIITAQEVGTSVVAASHNNATISQISIEVKQSSDLRADAGDDYTGIFYDKATGIWWYLEDGIVQKDYEGVEKNENGWWYINNGQVDFSYTGFAKNKNGWWYIENGQVTFKKNSVIKDVAGTIDGTVSWYYVVGSQVKFNFTGLADYSNENGWWYINDGKVTFDETTVAKNKNGWFFVEGSQVKFNYNGFAENSNGWWYIENGQVTFKKNSVIKDTAGKIDGTVSWYYVVGSQVKLNFTGLADYSNENGWWYINDGKVNFSVNTVAKNKNGWWYVLGSQVQFGFTGLADYSNVNGWWYIKNGQVDFDANTVAKNKNGWWYVDSGKVNFSFNGIASNENGFWYIQGGKVNFSYTGYCVYRGTTYIVVGGKVQYR